MKLEEITDAEFWKSYHLPYQTDVERYVAEVRARNGGRFLYEKKLLNRGENASQGATEMANSKTARKAKAAKPAATSTRHAAPKPGTVFTREYKGKTYELKVEPATEGEGVVYTVDGKPYGSPSAAASAITKGSVNGLVFWGIKK